LPVNSSQIKKRGNAKINEIASDSYGTITKQENTVHESFPSICTIAKDHRLKCVFDNISSWCPRQRRWVHGIDFSGAKDAGHKIWIASGFIEEGVLHIKECRRAEALPNASRERSRCLTALLDFIAKSEDGILGFDFPFGLPSPLVKKDRWEDFVLSFPGTFPNSREFRNICREAIKGAELKRLTDLEHRTPFSPYNLRLYRQTYFGIGYLLEPLVRNQMASVLPMQNALPYQPWVIEICPAATLKKENVYCSYKGKGKEYYNARAVILEKLEGLGFLQISEPEMRSIVLEDFHGDALDSIIAAFAAFRALDNLVSLIEMKNNAYAIEGYVFV
jgi:hypothetical protein